jgi:hypothetical protein
MPDHTISVPDASRQVRFHQLLVAARKTLLIDALSDSLGRIDPVRLKEQLLDYVPSESQQILAKSGVRDEHVFPTPVILETAPTLVGYYRLLLGVPQKSFYGSGTGMGAFKSMETSGSSNARQQALLPDFCRAMCAALADLMRQISPTVTERDVDELPLLTLGSFFQGANNVRIGKQATADVFLSIKEVVKRNVLEDRHNKIVVRNASGRRVILTLRHDPDIRVEEEFPGEARKKIAVEIKGGTDRSNAHNRAGEAEKSHQKAKKAGYRDFWTIIATKGVGVDKLRAESPTTTSWFDVAQILGRIGDDWDDFRSRLVEVVGIPLTRSRK